jgi:F-type H+-transporting ATPase subunit b
MLALLAQAAATSEDLKVLPGKDELIWGSVAFLVLVVVMIKFVFPKMRTALAERAAKIQGQLEEADRTKREADQILDQYRAQLNDARAEVSRIIEEGKKTAESLRKDLVAKAEVEAQSIVQRARQEVSGERDRALQELRSTLGDLSIQLAQRIIEKELAQPEAQRQLVERAIEDLTRTGSNN